MRFVVMQLQPICRARVRFTGQCMNFDIESLAALKSSYVTPYSDLVLP